MKLFSNFTNHNKASWVLLGLFFVVSSFSFRPVDDVALADSGPQKKVQRVKVLINKDGKMTSIDTTFNLADDKAVQVKVDSILKKAEIVGNVDGKSVFHMHKGGKVVKLSTTTGNNSSGSQQFDVFVQSGDSTGKDHEKRFIYFGDNGKMELSGIAEPNDMIPPPPPPPLPTFPKSNSGYFQPGVDPFSFDTKDASIISYEKKDIGKGLEKITIIRKKRSENDPNRETEVKVEVTDDQKK